MVGRRKRSLSSPEIQRAFAELEAATKDVDRARESLLASVPGRRGPGAPLAEALAGFELGLADALSRLTDPSQETAGLAARCHAAVDEALHRAERFRLEASPQGYEELYVALDELLEPLQAFDDVPVHGLRRSRR